VADADRRRIRVRGRGGNLLVSCGQLPVTGLVRLFDAAKGFTDHIPQAVWAGYGGQAADSSDGGTPR
jgi:hypothetical protein